MRLHLVRHPPPLVAPGVCYGATDLAVAPDQLARAAAALALSLPPDAALVTSPLQRCAELAARLPCAARTVDARLVEMDFGGWEMRRWDEIPRAEIDAWAADVVHHRPGGGDSVLRMAVRVAAAYDDLRQRHRHAGHVVAVCHAGTMRLLVARHAGLAPPEMAAQAAAAAHRIGYGDTIALDC